MFQPLCIKIMDFCYFSKIMQFYASWTSINVSICFREYFYDCFRIVDENQQHKNIIIKLLHLDHHRYHPSSQHITWSDLRSLEKLSISLKFRPKNLSLKFRGTRSNRNALKTCPRFELAIGARIQAQERLLSPSELGDTAFRRWKPLISPQISGTSLCKFLCICIRILE